MPNGTRTVKRNGHKGKSPRSESAEKYEGKLGSARSAWLCSLSLALLASTLLCLTKMERMIRFYTVVKVVEWKQHLLFTADMIGPKVTKHDSRVWLWVSFKLQISNALIVSHGSRSISQNGRVANLWN